MAKTQMVKQISDLVKFEKRRVKTLCQDANSSPGSTQTRQTSNKDTINHVQGSNNMMQRWYAMRDAMQVHMQDLTRDE